MENRVETIIKTIRDFANGAKSDEELTLAFYILLERQYDEGHINRGLYAKISAEQNYDDKLVKGAYIKSHVKTLLTRRSEILKTISKLEDLYEKRLSKQEKLIRLHGVQCHQGSAPSAPTNADIATARKIIAERFISKKGRTFNLYTPVAILTMLAGLASIYLVSENFNVVVIPLGLVALSIFLFHKDLQFEDRCSQDQRQIRDNPPVTNEELMEVAKKIQAARIDKQKQKIRIIQSEISVLEVERLAYENNLEQLFG